MLFILLLSLQSRRGELSMYRAMGLETLGAGKLVLGEMLLAGAGGMGAGVILGCAVSFLALPRIIYALQIAMRIFFSAAVLLRACAFGLGVCLACGVFGVLICARETVIGGLRHE
jgi:ABC-type antimicrobial peptide transport system permease subunit